jgi:thioredoxin 1
MSSSHFTDSSFKKEVLESVLPVLVDFWAVWCAPCKMISPLIEELAAEYKDKIKIGKLDVDNNPKTATYYGIMSIPTLIFFKDGKVAEQVVGVLNKVELKRKIEENLR